MELWDNQMLFQSLINTPVPMANSTGIKEHIRQSDSELDLSSRSSLGILPAELMEGSTDGFFNVPDENQRSAPSSRAEDGGKSSRQDYFCQDSQEGPGRATLKKKMPDVTAKPPREKNLTSQAGLFLGIPGMSLDGDADTSVHEVQLADDDLHQLDVDFSDLDLNTTVTDEERQQNGNEFEDKQAMGHAFDHIDSMYFRPAPTEGEEETGKTYNQSTMLRDPTGPGTCTFNRETFSNETVNTGLEAYGIQKQKLGFENSASDFGKEDPPYQGNRCIESESTGSDDYTRDRQQTNGIESEIDTEDELDAARRGIGDGTDNENHCLAFKLSLTRAAAEQQMMDEDFGVDDADFFGTDDAKVMLDADEKEFEKENIFSEVDNMQPVPGDTSWNVQASLLNCHPSWAPNASSDSSDPFRISMFIQERTDALGSLDGNPNVARPEFGLNIVTPPRNRQAKALISPVSGVSVPASNDNTRTSGVGDEAEDDDADSSDTTLSIDALKETLSADQSSSLAAGASTMLDDTSGMLSISSIVKAITDTSKVDHKELSELIISLSTMKSQESKAAKNKPEPTAMKKKPRTQSYDRKETKKPLVSKLPIRSNATSSKSIDRPENKEKALHKKDDRSHLLGSSANQNKTFNIDRKSKVEADVLTSVPLVGTQKSVKTPPIPSSKMEQSVIQGNKPVQPKALKPVKKLLEKVSSKGEVPMKRKPDGKESLVGNKPQGIGSPPIARAADSNPPMIAKLQGTSSPPIARAADSNPPMVSHKEEHIPKTPKKPWANDGGPHWDSPRSSLSATYSKEFEAKFRSKQLISRAKTHNSPVCVMQTLSEGADASQRLGLSDFHHQHHLDRETTPADGQAALVGVTMPQQAKSDIDNIASSNIETEAVNNDITTFQEHFNYLKLDQESHSVTDEMKADSTLHSFGLAGEGYNNDFRSRSDHHQNFHHRLEAEQPVTDTPTLLTSKSLLSTDWAKRSENMRQQLQMRHLPYASQGFHPSSPVLLVDDTLTNVFKPLSPQRLSLPLSPHHHSADDSCLSSYAFSQLEPSEMGHGDEFHVTAPSGFARLAVVIAPGEVRFSDVCCLGISTSAVVPLKNPTNRWQECHLKLAHLMKDGKNVDHEMSNPFQIKDRAIIEPNTTDEINMLFIPKSAGVYVAQLQVFCHQFSQTMPTASHDIPTIVTLQAIAEKPDIQILNENPSSMDFGQLRWGNSHSLPLQFINRGQAAVPLRLSLSANNAAWHCFSFEKEASCNVSTISKSSRPSLTALSKSVINLLLKGTQGGIVPDPVEVMVYCSAPEKQWERGLPPCRPEELTACVNLEVDLPTPAVSPISRVTLRALVGEPRLHIINSAQGVVMKSKFGQAYKESFPMKNVGNIDMPVTLRAADYGDIFLIEPSTVLLKPECNMDVEITFIPKDRSCKTYNTLLLLYIEPSGPLFEVDITGHVIEVPPKPTTKVSVLTDTDDLVFGGVAVGRAE